MRERDQITGQGGSDSAPIAVPEVSVIIPTRDRCDLLSTALSSALNQRSVSLEVIIIDDGSRDQTCDQLERLGDPRVRVVRHTTSLGVAQARNRGLHEARAPWLAFLDDDDVWAPQKLRAQLDIAAEQGASFVFSSMLFFDDRNGVRRRVAATPPEKLASVILKRNVVGAPSALIAETALVRQAGGFDPQLSTIADWDLWIRLAALGTGAACEELLVGYRLHEGNMQAHVERAELRREYDHLAVKHANGDRIQAQYAAHLGWIYRQQGQRFAASRQYLLAAVRGGGMSHGLRALGVLLGERLMTLPLRLRSRIASEQEWLHPDQPPPASAQVRDLAMT